MLVMKRSGADRSTFLDHWETYVLLQNDAEVGRIEIHTNEGHVTVQGSQFPLPHPSYSQATPYVHPRQVGHVRGRNRTARGQTRGG